MRRLVASLLLLTLCVSAVPALAQDADSERERGRVLTEEGIEQLKAGNNRAALQRFEDAEKLLQTSRSALRVATALEKLERCREALQWADKVAPRATPENDPDGAARREAGDIIKRCHETMATILIVAPAAAAGTLTLDGEAVPLVAGRAQVRVDPGQHEAVLDVRGRQDRRPFLAPRGKEVEIRFDQASTSTTQETPPSADIPDSSLPLWPFLVGGGGLLLGAVAGGLAGGAAATESDLFELCPESNGAPTCSNEEDLAEADNLQSRVRALNGAAIGVGIAGGVLLITGVIGLAVGASASNDTALVLPWVGRDVVGVTAFGRF